MITWHKIHEGSYEGRVGKAILATVWYDTPLFFNKKSATWKCRTSFPGVGVRGFGATFDTREEAQEAMEKFVKWVAESALTV